MSANELNDKVNEFINNGRKVVIITTYHSLMKLGSLDIDTLYCDEAHILATEAQQSLFMTNFNLINAKRIFFFTATPKDCNDENTEAFLMNNESIFGKRIGITFAIAVAKGYIVSPDMHLVMPADFEEGIEYDFGIENKVSFIIDAFRAHKQYMKTKSVNPDKLGIKILVKCSSVTDEMWPIYRQLVGRIPNVKIFAGASVENTENYNLQGKHFIDGRQINRRDAYLKEMQDMKSEDDAIVLHFDILSEGINVSGFTGVMFLSGMLLTITKILQNIGRTTRLHYLDRQNLLNDLISVNEKSKWIKPCCAVIIPYWNDESNSTRRLMSRVINELRTRLDFEARLIVNLGTDTGRTNHTDENDPTLIEEDINLRNSIIDEIEHEIEGIRINALNLEEENRVMSLPEDDWFDEVLQSLK